MSMTIDCARKLARRGEEACHCLANAYYLAPAPERQTRPVLHQALLSRVSLSGQLFQCITCRNGYFIEVANSYRKLVGWHEYLACIHLEAVSHTRWLVFNASGRMKVSFRDRNTHSSTPGVRDATTNIEDRPRSYAEKCISQVFSHSICENKEPVSLVVVSWLSSVRKDRDFGVVDSMKPAISPAGFVCVTFNTL